MRTIDGRSDSQAMEFCGSDLIQRVMGCIGVEGFFGSQVKAIDFFELQD